MNGNFSKTIFPKQKNKQSMFTNVQTLEPFSDSDFQSFSSIEALRSNEIPDNILGLGNRKKKGEKKIAKAEKAIASGNVGKAQRKLDKAGKKIAKDKKHDTTQTQESLISAQKDLTSINQAKLNSLAEQDAAKKLSSPMQIDPSTVQDAPNISGSGLSMPLASGGGGDIGGGGGGDMGADYSQQSATDPGNNDVMTPVTITSSKMNPLLIAVVVFVVVGIIIFVTRKK